MPAEHNIPAVEPADPQVRKEEGLPPKSYAAAAEEALHDENTHDPSPPDSSEHKPLQFQHNIENIKTKNIPISPPTSSDNEFEGQGLDNSPKSPPRGHRRKVSHKASGSLGRTVGEKASHEVLEDYKSANGKPLTSVKPPAELEKRTVDQSRQPRERDALTAGRTAGAGWQKSKIRWAPLNIPVQRRLQTLAVLMHTLSIAGGLTIFFFLCSIPLLWPILLPYLIYVLFSNAGVSGELYWRSEYWRNSKIWSLFASYFPARLHRSQELEPTRKYIFGYHPHGIISHGAFAAFATEALGFGQLFPGITNTLLTLDSNFHIPLYREYALRMGLGSVSGESIRNILSKGGRNREGMGRAVTIVIGGARESLESKPGSFRLVLNRRKGFIKMAIRTGADLVPVLAFGENEIYDQVDAKSHPYIHKLQLLVKKVMGFTVPLFHARGIFNYDVGMMPYRRPLNIVTGRPIRIVQEDHPDNHTIDQYHQQYVDELMRIWNDWKDTFAQDRKSELELIE
ncbi:diacylglycerol O-acyltransferas-like protein 2B [Lophiostoma macrostomum CBS 122681]|uniref:diacylglycerol O-acyltransferase n=1 Tax=Lophiostoma macrostomum CBS 122681 TaxID=1314788 RepID=A0A6A6SPV0_9PLEO|nr:diacylglycerol O-acyltransferas-like protein 2B [Lophiostoma macrostomum CBS 122681]